MKQSRKSRKCRKKSRKIRKTRKSKKSRRFVKYGGDPPDTDAAKLNKDLIYACQSQNIEKVRELLQARADPNIQNNNGNTALMAACLRNNVDIVRELLQAGANPNIRNNRGITALIRACLDEYVEIVGELLQAGADPNIQDNIGNSALIYACDIGNIELIELLVSDMNADFIKINHDAALQEIIDDVNIDESNKINLVRSFLLRGAKYEDDGAVDQFIQHNRLIFTIMNEP